MKRNQDTSRQCLGWEGNGCTNTAGTPWSPYWCHDCNALRLAHIDSQLNAIATPAVRVLLKGENDVP